MKLLPLLFLLACSPPKPDYVKLHCPEPLPQGYTLKYDQLYWITKGDSVFCVADIDAFNFQFEAGLFAQPFTTEDSCNVKYYFEQWRINLK